MESNNIIRKKKRKRISYLIVLYGKNSNYFEIIYPAIKIGPKSCFKKKKKENKKNGLKAVYKSSQTLLVEIFLIFKLI